MYDYLEILGLPANALASEIRRASARRAHRLHPDFRPASQAGPPDVSQTARQPATDAAVDFVDMTALVERMQAAFFADRP